MIPYAILMALISTTLFAWVVGAEADEIGLRDLFILAFALIAILAVEIFLLRIIETILKRRPIGFLNIVLLGTTAAVLAANSYFMAFYTVEAPTLMRVAYAVVVGVVFIGLMQLPLARPILALFAVFSILFSLFTYTSTRIHLQSEDVSNKIAALPIGSDRNIYLIGMESLQSPKAYRDNFDINNPPHVEVLKSAGFRVLDQAYSAAKSTLRSYATIFEFKRDFNSTELGEREVFVNDNSTFRSFRESNYSIQTLYKNNYFPVNLENVNFKYPPPGFDACDELGSYFFYGLCSSRVVSAINQVVFGTEKMPWRAQISLLQRRTDAIGDTKGPWFTWTHIKYPFHTHGYMRYPDPPYTEKFRGWVRDAMPKIAQNMKDTALYIVSRDTRAVVIVIGDHGPHLFRGPQKAIRAQVFSDSPLVPLENILEDQHGINFAVYPADFCVNRMSESFSTRFLIENLIACLNGNDAPTAEERKRARTVNFLGELTDVDELRQKVDSSTHPSP